MPIHQSRKYSPLFLALSCLSVVFSQHIAASGFAVPEASITGLGASNALVANPDEIGAIAYNPAAMAFHEKSSISAGALAIRPDLEVKTGSGNHNSEGSNTVGIPLFQGTLRIAKDWSLGLGVATPFGLETKWETDVFPGFSGPLAPLATTHSKLDLLAFTPAVAFRINEYLSVSGGLDYYKALDVKLNSAAIEIEGDGDEIGWNLGLMLNMDDWSFGVSYHSDVRIDIKGHFKASPPAGTGARISADANLDLPWRLQAGVRWKATEKLAVEFDITRTGWSEFDRLLVKTDGSFGPLPSGAVLTSTTNKWDDANAYRLGGTYQLAPKTQLRFGYSFDKTPQNDDHFSARIPDEDRHLFSVGLGHDFGGGWGIDVGYMYVRFKDRNYSSNTPFTGGDPNGTSAFNGDYQSSVHLLGLGVSKTFM